MLAGEADVRLEVPAHRSFHEDVSDEFAEKAKAEGTSGWRFHAVTLA